MRGSRWGFNANCSIVEERLKWFEEGKVTTAVVVKNLEGETVSMTSHRSFVERLMRSENRERGIRSVTRSRVSLIKAN